jgi:NAD(P)-dependent dehydrogenase (short-subunit alcohol dehydrogenase family)
MTQELFSLAERVAVVTGALGFLGRHHCRALGGAGARVVCLDVDEAGCRALAGELAKEDIQAIGLQADIVDESSITSALAATLSRFGRVDVLVNNAAIDDKADGPSAAPEGGRFELFPLELFRRVLDVNVAGTFVTAKIFGSEMAKRGKGSIVNVASTYGLVAPDQSLYRRPDGTQKFFKGPAYPTSKGAVVAFTRFLAAYWAEAGVRVNTLTPGGVMRGHDPEFVAAYSKRTPMGRMAEPRDLAGALVYLASDASAYVTGSNVVVDGGFTAW